MKVLVTGSSGLVGRALLPALRADGHEVVRLVRSNGGATDAYEWSPAGDVDPAALDGVDAVIHLAGEPIADGRWTTTRKNEIRASRVAGTDTLARAIAAAEPRPRVLICASAIGFYGDRGDEVLDEGSTPGEGFLTDVCREWEAAADPARDAGVRVAHMRLGVILSPDGGLLKRLLLPFKLGGGGILGNGRQWMSWVSLPDVVKALRHALDDESVSGPVNLVAPEPVTNKTFTKALGKALKRPTILPMPAFAARLAFGELADALMLSSARVVPTALDQHGFTFDHPQVDQALGDLLSA